LISALGELEKGGSHKFGSGIKVLHSCTRCGLCVNNCCSSNIVFEIQEERGVTGKPKFGNRCDMCLGCIYNCPKNALRPTWGAFQVDKKGYDLHLMCQEAKLNY
jgi:ferredoxin